MLFFRKKSLRTQSIFPYFCLLYATSFAVIFSTYQNICSAMTVDEFVHFLANPPLHGHVQINQITPIHSKEAGITNRLVQTYDYLWSGENVFSTVQEGKYKKQSGTFRTVEWDHLDGNLTKYAGINKNDAMRHRSPLNENIANLKALGIYSLSANRD